MYVSLLFIYRYFQDRTGLNYVGFRIPFTYLMEIKGRLYKSLETDRPYLKLGRRRHASNRKRRIKIVS